MMLQHEELTMKQLDDLSRPLDMRRIRHRKGAGGRMYAYLTGKTVIDTANRIFGYGGWGVKVLSRSRETCIDSKKGEIEFYTCDIELYVVGAAFPFPGDGVGIVTEPFTIEMHEKARKDAYSDALKRAFRHFGDQFGLVLSDPDGLVLAPNGSFVQVKAILEHSSKPSPTLDEQIKQAKLRARKLGLAHDATEWASFLSACKVAAIHGPLDLAKIHEHLTSVEQSVNAQKGRGV